MDFSRSTVGRAHAAIWGNKQTEEHRASVGAIARELRNPNDFPEFLAFLTKEKGAGVISHLYNEAGLVLKHRDEVVGIFEKFAWHGKKLAKKERDVAFALLQLWDHFTAEAEPPTPNQQLAAARRPCHDTPPIRPRKAWGLPNLSLAR